MNLARALLALLALCFAVFGTRRAPPTHWAVGVAAILLAVAELLPVASALRP